VKLNDCLVPSSVRGERIEDLQSQLKYEEKNFAQIGRKLLVAKVDYLLSDYNVVNYEKTLNYFVKGLELAQEVANLLVIR
jgi:hypothetical protein